jgi:Flp pilus assembly pilin Flp
MLIHRVLELTRDQRGAELVEWVIWVAALATVSGTTALALSGSLNAAITSITGLVGGS